MVKLLLISFACDLWHEQITFPAKAQRRKEKLNRFLCAFAPLREIVAFI
jgi:hypothetical protein